MKLSAAVIRRLHVIAAPVVTGAALLLLSSCSTPSGVASYRALSAPASQGAVGRSAMQERPGLGTTLGTEYHDDTTSTQFYRRLPSSPDYVASFHYNDQEGAKAMAEFVGSGSKRGGSFKLAGGKLRASLETWGDTLPWYEARGKIFVVGEAGRNYSITLENTTKDRLEVVVSVDGLDVLSGTAASTSRRGYVIPKNGKISIAGMRVGGKMRRFEFGSVRDSQAAKTGGESGARNVGVVGLAVYVEDSAAAKLARIKEGMTRDDARAFPGS